MSGIIGTSHSKAKIIGRSQDTAKAWCNFNGSGTVAIRDSFNVSSITDNGTGIYSVHWERDMNDSNYCTTAGCQDYSLSMSTDQNGKDATYQKFYVSNFSVSLTDSAQINVMVMGD